MLDPADKSSFLGDIKAGCSQSCLETNMYRASIFPHKVSSTDYLLVRSARGKLSIRRIDRLDVVGQQITLRGSSGQLYWIMRRNFYIPLEEELRRMVTLENVCAYESMLAGLYKLKRLGITRLTNFNGLSSAMNQLPHEAIALAAASHNKRELQITTWSLSSNFVTCTSQIFPV